MIPIPPFEPLRCRRGSDCSSGKRPSSPTVCLDVVRRSLDQETDSFVLRVAIHAAADGASYLRDSESPLLERWTETLIESLGNLHVQNESLAVRRWAALARERMWCATNDDARTLRVRFEALLKDIRCGDRLAQSAEDFVDVEADTLGRVLSVLTQEDFGVDLDRGRRKFRFLRGHKFGFRLWRFLHEFRNPSPDKRQAYPHTIGRLFRGDVRAPSAILSELAETKVPGEPLYIGPEQGWRPYLPLVDDVLSALDRSSFSRPVRFYTSEGITELVPPKSWIDRLRAYAKITWRFREFARKRNWKSKESGNPKDYLESLRELGFKISIRPYTDVDGREHELDPAVTRFFPSVGLPFFDPQIWDQLKTYFISVYENTLFELAAFTSAAVAIFAGRHMYANYTMAKARDAIPLVLGGWGTRGKSGTERIKAALFSALGYGFVSKTTGCEAMFLYAMPYGKTREMFLFRPYDKATIWEQRNVVRISAELGTEVFLWECMGLTPSYVEILQRQWMRDDISTITNTYPDHEDLQGPAGVNIPYVMCDFIPQRSTLFTSEEQMVPILVEAAGDQNTEIYSIGWLEAGLLTKDILERFPYEEHPFNIALVLHLAQEIGIEKDFALKAMADNVVADIGVLKTYPPAPCRTRQLEFTNGMSANERHGCLGNWTRLGFDTCHPVDDADRWLCTVVNNRSDRIARSRVFADLLARDISADRHVLIGNNLAGLEGYIQEAWDSYAATFTLDSRNEDGEREDPVGIVTALFHKLRMPTHEDHLKARLRAMLGGQDIPVNAGQAVEHWSDPPALRSLLQEAGLTLLADEIVSYVEDMNACLGEYRDLVAKIERGGNPAAYDDEFRQVAWKWFHWKFVVVDDYFATGNQVIERICSATPPGLHARIMGLQNIKGTGLDFVYRWQAWENCWRGATLLRSPDVRDMEQGLKELSAFRDFGVLSEEFVKETIEIVRRSPNAQRESVQTELGLVESNLASAMRVIREQAGDSDGEESGGGRWSRFTERTCEFLEELLDAGDAVKRRKIANLIYKDLISERISSERAALELSSLNKRQKGGWLYKGVKSTQEALSRRAATLIRKGPGI